jgi:threonine/homoserine/homoserine lactone efflux protein
MMTLNLVLALAAFALVSSLTPGPNNLMLMASGTHFGFARTVPHMLGVSIGFLFMVILVGLGLVGIFKAFPVSYVILKWVSVVYLLYLAWHIATAGALVVKESGLEAQEAKPMRFYQAVLFQWVNPKAWTMALTAITVYAPSQKPLLGLVTVAVIFGAINLPSVGLWALLGVQMRRFLDQPGKMRAFNITAALLLVATLYPVVEELFHKHH